MQKRRAAVRQLVYSSAIVLAQAAMPEGAAPATLEDSFAGGATQLEWTTYPMFKGGAVQGRSVEDAPDGDGGIGVLQHEGGALATVSYAQAEGGGQLRHLGLGVLYRLVCDDRFGTGSFSLAYVGANIGRQPLELERWPLIEQAAPVTDDGWRRVRIEVEAGLIELYRDDGKLNERPLPAERVTPDIVNIDAGYAGVYAGHIGAAGTAEARVDDLTYVIPCVLSIGPGCRQIRAAASAAGQVSSCLPFLLAGLVERSTRSRRSGISW